MYPITEIVSLLQTNQERTWILMVMASLKTGHDAARCRFWLAMSGFVMALALMPFSYKVERRLETAVHIKGGESEKVRERPGSEEEQNCRYRQTQLAREN
jgi:hypothetical protein